MVRLLQQITRARAKVRVLCGGIKIYRHSAKSRVRVEWLKTLHVRTAQDELLHHTVLVSVAGERNRRHPPGVFDVTVGVFSSCNVAP